MIQIWKEFTFDAAHFLPNVPDGHKCKREHGHTYRIRVWLTGPIDPILGWIEDYATLAAAWAQVHDQIDHYQLNGIPGLDNPTTEILIAWIWERLAPLLPGMCKLELNESSTTCAVMEQAR